MTNHNHVSEHSREASFFPAKLRYRQSGGEEKERKISPLNHEITLVHIMTHSL